MLSNLRAEKTIIRYRNDEYDFTRLKPRKNGVEFNTKSELMRECVDIMHFCGYPFDFRCPMPPLFANGVNNLTWQLLGYCLWFVLDFAESFSYEPWNRNVKWLGFSFWACGDNISSPYRLYNVSLRHKESDDIIKSCLCSKEQIPSIVENFLDMSISYTYVYIK